VTDSAGTFYTNFVYVYVDTQFTKINDGPLAVDRGTSESASWGDYDGDGYDDLFVARWDKGLTTLYHNNGNNTFTPTPGLPSQTVTNNWQAGAWADFDNDQRLDLFVARLEGPSFFYFNNGDGTFTQSQFESLKVYAIALTDYNRDGRLDVFTSSWQGGSPALFRNNGNRTFTRVTSDEAGLLVSTNTWGGGQWADYDEDGLLEVYLARFAAKLNMIFHNDGTGRFVPVTNLVTSTAQAAITGAWGDYDNDGWLDLVVADYYGPSLVYRNLHNGEFERANLGVTLGKGYSASWADYDNDGFLDLFLTYTNALYHNNGDGTFTRVTTGTVGVEQPEGTYGASYTSSWFDYDNDGFLDLYVPCGNEGGPTMAYIPNLFYHNNGNSNAWLVVKPLGTKSNRSGIGATVRVQTYSAGQARWQRREITSGGGDVANGQQLYAHFGLGNATSVARLKIEWPSGVVEEFASVAPRQILTVVEPNLKGSMGQDGKFHVWMTMSTLRSYQLQASTNFVDWTVLTNCTGSGSSEPIEYVDPEAPAAGAARFYRMK
jgi:hypothetical protein